METIELKRRLIDIKQLLIKSRDLKKEISDLKTNNKSSILIVLSILLAAIVLTLDSSIFIVYLIISTITITNYLNKDKRRKENKINPLMKELEEIENKLNGITIVPKYYLHLKAINSFIRCLDEDRAKTIEECKLIYEIDSRQEALDYREKIIHEKNEEIKKRLYEIEKREKELSNKEKEIIPLHEKLVKENEYVLSLQDRLMSRLYTNEHDK